jgi:hypothetical protein
MTPVFERAKTVHALDRAATVIVVRTEYRGKLLQMMMMMMMMMMRKCSNFLFV